MVKTLKSAFVRPVAITPSASGHSNFLPVRTLLLIVIICLSACKGPQVVSSTIKESHKRDSATTVTKTEKDSISYVEKEIKKTLPASSVENTYTRAQLDSLIAGLKQLPAGHRSIIQTDPKMQTTLSIILDSLGKVHFKCTTAERIYYERDVEKSRQIQSFTVALTKANEENSVLREQIKEYKKGFWEKLKDSAQNLLLKILLIIIVVGVIIMLIEYGWTKIKTFIKGKIL